MEREARAARYALVTGGSSGIGLETARGLMKHFEVVGIVGRNPERLAEAAENLRRSGDGRIETFQADFCSLAEVRRLATEIKAHFPSLGVLVNNAGVWHKRRTLSKDGYEATFAVNHLAHFLLTNELKELLVTAPSRVVNVASSMHARPRSMSWDDLMFERHWRGFRVYGHSKLANVLFSNELARRWEGLKVTSNALNPGNVRSRITRNSPLLNVLHHSSVARLVLMSEAKGARTSIYVATAPELEGVTGRYFDRMKEARPSSASRDRDAARRLWEVSEKLVGAVIGL